MPSAHGSLSSSCRQSNHRWIRRPGRRYPRVPGYRIPYWWRMCRIWWGNSHHPHRSVLRCRNQSRRLNLCKNTHRNYSPLHPYHHHRQNSQKCRQRPYHWHKHPQDRNVRYRDRVLQHRWLQTHYAYCLLPKLWVNRLILSGHRHPLQFQCVNRIPHTP